SRAAFAGGCAATSNLLAGRLYDIPVRGTHAHSWVMLFGDEREAFDAWAEAMPGNCLLLVDTYDTIAGVRHAIEVGRALRERGGGLGAPCTIRGPADPIRRKTVPAGTPGEDLLVPIFRGGRRVYEGPPLAAVRARTGEQLARLHAGIKRFLNPHLYPAGLDERL